MKPLFPGKSEIDQINRIFKVRQQVIVSADLVIMVMLMSLSSFQFRFSTVKYMH